MSNPLDVTTLKAIRDPSMDQAGLMPLIGCGSSGPSSPVSGSTGEQLGSPAARRGESDPGAIRRPLRLVVQPGFVDELSQPRPVGVHDLDVPVAVPVGAECQSRTVRRPAGIEVPPRVTRELRDAGAVEVDDLDVAGHRRSGVERDPLAVGRPRGWDTGGRSTVSRRTPEPSGLMTKSASIPSRSETNAMRPDETAVMMCRRPIVIADHVVRRVQPIATTVTVATNVRLIEAGVRAAWCEHGLPDTPWPRGRMAT